MRGEISTTAESGYSTQATLSLRIADMINSGRIHLYFATELNPAHNSPVANPLEIFAKLDRLARGSRQPVHERKPQTIQRALRSWIHQWFREGRVAQSTLAEALHEIKTLDAGRAFAPVLLRLSGVVGASIGAQPDEFIAQNEVWRDTRQLSRSEIGAHL